MKNTQYDSWKLASPFDDLEPVNSVVAFEDLQFETDGDEYSIDGSAAVVNGNVVELDVKAAYVWNGQEWVDTDVDVRKLALDNVNLLDKLDDLALDV